MNQADRKEFELIHNKIDNITSSLSELRDEMDKAHQKVDDNLSFVKENLFNPHEGLWAETTLRNGEVLWEQEYLVCSLNIYGTYSTPDREIKKFFLF